MESKSVILSFLVFVFLFATVKIVIVEQGNKKTGNLFNYSFPIYFTVAVMRGLAPYVKKTEYQMTVVKEDIKDKVEVVTTKKEDIFAFSPTVSRYIF